MSEERLKRYYATRTVVKTVFYIDTDGAMTTNPHQAKIYDARSMADADAICNNCTVICFTVERKPILGMYPPGPELFAD